MKNIVLGEGKVFTCSEVNIKTSYPRFIYCDVEFDADIELPESAVAVEYKSSAVIQDHIRRLSELYDYLVKYENFLVVQEEYNRLLDDYHNGLSETEKYKIQYEKYLKILQDYEESLNN